MIIAAQACACLANLAEMAENQEIIAREGGVRPTIQVMRSRYVEVQREAGRLLANLCASDSETSDMIVRGRRAPVTHILLVVARYGLSEGRSVGIGNLCTQERHRVPLMDSGSRTLMYVSSLRRY